MHLPTFLFSAHHRWAAFEKWMENTHNNTLCRRLAAVSVVEVRGCCTICGAAVLCASEKTRNRRWRRRSGWLCSCFFYEKCISQSYVYDAAKYKNRHVREKAKRSAKNDQQRHYKLILFCSTFTIYSIRCVFSLVSPPFIYLHRILQSFQWAIILIHLSSAFAQHGRTAKDTQRSLIEKEVHRKLVWMPHNRFLGQIKVWWIVKVHVEVKLPLKCKQIRN